MIKYLRMKLNLRIIRDYILPPCTRIEADAQQHPPWFLSINPYYLLSTIPFHIINRIIIFRIASL